MGNVLTGYVAGFRGTAEALLQRITELETRDYPTALSKKLLSVFGDAIQESRRIVEELDPEDESTESTVLRHGNLLSLFHQFVHLVSSSVGHDVPRWAIQPMKYEIAKYLKSEVDILIVGGQEGGNFAYDYRLDRLEHVLKAAYGPLGEELAKRLPRHMAVFHFPFGERDNVLAHGAFFHEVGHQIDIGIRGISERVGQAFLAEKDAEIREKVREHSQEVLARIFRGKAQGAQTTIEDERAEILLEEVVKAIQIVLANWAREFCADLIATRILGPAYALVVVISPALLNNLRLNAPTHPATILRLRVIIELLGRNKAGDYFNDCDAALEIAGVRSLLHEWRTRVKDAGKESLKWHESVHGVASAQVNVLTIQLAEDLANRMLDAVVAETTDQGYYTPAQYTRDIDEVLPSLNRGITINETVDYGKQTHSPNQIATIFNVGVAQYLSQASPSDRAKLSKLLRKSIELSQIQLKLQDVAALDESE